MSAKKTAVWGLKSPEGWLVEGERALFTHTKDVRKASCYETRAEAQEALARARHSVETGAVTYERIRKAKTEGKKKTVTTWVIRGPSGAYLKIGGKGENDTLVTKPSGGATEFDVLDEALETASKKGGRAIAWTRRRSEKKETPPLRSGKKSWTPEIGEEVVHRLEPGYGTGTVQGNNEQEKTTLVRWGMDSIAPAELWSATKHLEPAPTELEKAHRAEAAKRRWVVQVEEGYVVFGGLGVKNHSVKTKKEATHFDSAIQARDHADQVGGVVKPYVEGESASTSSDECSSRFLVTCDRAAGHALLKHGSGSVRWTDTEAAEEDDENPARLRDPKAFDAIVDRWKVAQARADALDDEGVSGFGRELFETTGFAAGLEWALNQLGVTTLKKSETPGPSVPLHWVVEVAFTRGGRGFLKRNEKNPKFIYAKEPEDGEKFASEDAARAVANEFIRKTHKRAVPMPIYMQIVPETRKGELGPGEGLRFGARVVHAWDEESSRRRGVGHIAGIGEYREDGRSIKVRWSKHATSSPAIDDEIGFHKPDELQVVFYPDTGEVPVVKKPVEDADPLAALLSKIRHGENVAVMKDQATQALNLLYRTQASSERSPRVEVSGMPKLVVPRKVLKGLELLVESFEVSETARPDTVKQAQLWIKGLTETVIVTCSECLDDFAYSETKVGLCLECYRMMKEAKKAKRSSTDRSTYHAMLDRAMDKTEQGSNFLPRFTELVLRDVFDMRPATGDCP